MSLLSTSAAPPVAACPQADTRQSFTLAATSLGFVVVQLDVTIVNVALQQIGATFGGGIAGLQWVVDAYTVVFASLIPTAGALGDRIGAKRVFIAGFIVFTVASLACAAAPGLLVLTAARGLQGVGAAAPASRWPRGRFSAGCLSRPLAGGASFSSMRRSASWECG